MRDSGPGGSVSSFTQHKDGRADWDDLKLKNISSTTSVWTENRDVNGDFFLITPTSDKSHDNLLFNVTATSVSL